MPARIVDRNEPPLAKSDTLPVSIADWHLRFSRLRLDMIHRSNAELFVVWVFCIQYTEIDLKTREEYLALVPGKWLTYRGIGTTAQKKATKMNAPSISS